MPRQPNGAGRYYVTLEAADADALEAAARQHGRPPTTEAGIRIVQTIRADLDGADALARVQAELVDTRRELESTRAANAALQRRLSQLGGAEEDGPPRWEWPMDRLLADREWWRTWLPRLHEVVGRPAAFGASSGGQPVVDERGYVDLMSMLFPPIEGVAGAVVEWRSIEYPAAVRARSNAAGLPLGDVWESVIRHVAIALCALEMTAGAGTSPTERIRTAEDIRRSWLETLGRLTGAAPADLSAVRGGYR